MNAGPDRLIILLERWQRARGHKQRRHLRRAILREIERREHGQWHRRRGR